MQVVLSNRGATFGASSSTPPPLALVDIKGAAPRTPSGPGRSPSSKGMLGRALSFGRVPASAKYIHGPKKSSTKRLLERQSSSQQQQQPQQQPPPLGAASSNNNSHRSFSTRFLLVGYSADLGDAHAAGADHAVPTRSQCIAGPRANH